MVATQFDQNWEGKYIKNIINNYIQSNKKKILAREDNQLCLKEREKTLSGELTGSKTHGGYHSLYNGPPTPPTTDRRTNTIVSSLWGGFHFPMRVAFTAQTIQLDNGHTTS